MGGGSDVQVRPLLSPPPRKRARAFVEWYDDYVSRMMLFCCLCAPVTQRARYAVVDDLRERGRRLPDGWTESPSRSRPGEYSYENQHTGETIDWWPSKAASPTKDQLPPPWKD